MEMSETRLDVMRLVLQVKARMIAENATLNHLTEEEKLDLAKKMLSEVVFSTFVTERSLIGKIDSKGVEIRNGDTVKGLGEHSGQSEVFPTEYHDGERVIWQPFSYLNDYSGRNYEVVNSPPFGEKR
ncbi:MAG: hypothetical protein V3T88_01570 [Nitrosomonadaceae bacterium]